jgi:peptide/nickel transport system permease protein
VITAVTFLIFYVLPTADPAALRAGRDPSPELIQAIKHQLGLDQSLPSQYWNYTKALFLHFDFGQSFINNTSVKSLIFDRLPNTIFLVVGAAIIWFVSGVVIGIVSATKRGSFWDRFLMGGALIAISAPVYWMGLVALYLFSNDIGVWHIFPGSGAYQDAHTFPAKCWAMVMPWCVLAAAFAAIYARLLRSNLLETMGEDYIRTARAKGLGERRVIGGAILTETVFNIDGIGRLSYDAIQRGDLATIQGTTIVLAAGVAIMSLVVDILYAFLDPRVRY